MMYSRTSQCSANVLATFVCIVIAFGNAALPGADDTLEEREGRIERMTPEEKEELRRKQGRFEDMENFSEEKRDRLRKLYDQISSRADADELHKTLESYHEWLGTLSPPQRSKLLDIKNIDERIAQMKELMKLQEENRFRLLVGNLSPEDRNVIYKWLEDFALRHEEEIIERTKREYRDRLSRSDNPDEASRRRSLIGAWHWQYRGRAEGTPQPSSADFEELLKDLSPEGKKLIEPTLDTEQRHARLAEIVGRALYSRYTPPISEQDLRKFHAELPPHERERLESMDGDQVKSELRKMYHFAKMRSRGFGGPRSGSPPGGFGPPRPGPGDGGRGRRDEGRDRDSDRDHNDDRNREGKRDRDDDNAPRDERASAPGNEAKDCCHDSDECRGCTCQGRDNFRDAKRRA
jgi:hypothetical protein